MHNLETPIGLCRPPVADDQGPCRELPPPHEDLSQSSAGLGPRHPLLVEAGLTPYQAIETATVQAAKTLGIAEQVGQIEEGYVADLVLVDGDPTQDIDALLAPSGVVVLGRWYGPEEIAALERRAAGTSAERTEQRVLEGLAAQGSPLG